MLYPLFPSFFAGLEYQGGRGRRNDEPNLVRPAARFVFDQVRRYPWLCVRQSGLNLAHVVLGKAYRRCIGQPLRLLRVRFRCGR